MTYLPKYYTLQRKVLNYYDDKLGRSSRAFNERFGEKNFMANERFFLTLPKYYIEISGVDFLGTDSIGITVLEVGNIFKERDSIPLFDTAENALEFINTLAKD